MNGNTTQHVVPPSMILAKSLSDDDDDVEWCR